MNQIKKESLNLKIQNNYLYTFEIPESGTCLIEIIASAKSWWQNFKNLKSFFNDDDLTLKIDDIEFPKLNGKKGLFDGEVAWNGNNLKGLSKTNIFLINFEKGNHSLNFSADKNPIIESIAIYKIDEVEISYIPEKNNPAQDGNRRQWMTIIPVSISIKKLNIKASAKNYPERKDDNDIKIIIDGNIQKNETAKSHKNWHWCGRILNGQEKEFNKELNLESGAHYVELWADGMPEINEIKLVLNSVGDNAKKGRIVLHKDILATDFVNLRKDHNTKSEIVSQLENGSEIEIIEEIVEGEKIINYSKIWHKIKYQEKEGYILSSYIEIEGQERDKIVEKIRAQAEKYDIDENYAVALAGCESRYKPYAVSFGGALGIFQFTSIARRELLRKFNFQLSDEDSFNADKNIEAGVIYLKDLFSIYAGSQDEYKKVTAAWNAGVSLIPIEGAISFDKIIDLIKRKEAQDLVNRVEKNRKSKDWGYILPVAFIFLVALSILSPFFYKNNLTEKVSAVEIPKEDLIYSDNEFRFTKPYSGIKTININGESPQPTEWYTNVVIEYEDGRIDKKVYPGFLDNAYMFDIYSFKDLIIVRQEMKYISTSILRYNEKRKLLEEIKFIQKDGLSQDSLCCSNIIFKPFENGAQYDLGVRYFFGKEESTYEYDSEEGNFIETERGYVKEGPKS